MSSTSVSLHETLVNTINDVVENYIDRIVDKYNLDKAQLQELWSGEVSPSKKVSKKNKPARPVDELIDTDDASDERILKSNKAELAALCKARGIKCTGTKAVLINRLLGKEDGEEEKTEKPKKAPVKKVVKPTESSSSKVVKKMLDEVDKLSIAPIRRNQFNNYQHPETKLVFHAQTREVIGHQNDDGTIGELTTADINNCKKYKFKYTMPENLSNVKGKVVKEEEDEDVSEEEEDEEEINVVDDEEDDDDSDDDEEDSDVEVDDD